MGVEKRFRPQFTPGYGKFDGVVTANEGYVDAVESVSTGAIASYGLTVLASTADVVHTLASPIAGKVKYIQKVADSTKLAQVKSAAGITFATTSGAKQVLKFNGDGQAVNLVGISTAKWAVVSNIGVTYSTST